MSSEAENDVDPVLNYVLLGDTIADGLYMWISIGLDTSASLEGSAAATLTADGGVENESSGMGGDSMGGSMGGSGGPSGNSTGGGNGTAPGGFGSSLMASGVATSAASSATSKSTSASSTTSGSAVTSSAISAAAGRVRPAFSFLF